MKAIGAAEFPPDTLDCVPHSVSNEPNCTGAVDKPLAAFAMPYIGFSGLLPVSFCDIAGMTTPFTPARVAADAFSLMPRAIAESMWKSRPRLLSMFALAVG